MSVGMWQSVCLSSHHLECQEVSSWRLVHMGTKGWPVVQEYSLGCSPQSQHGWGGLVYTHLLCKPDDVYTYRHTQTWMYGWRYSCNQKDDLQGRGSYTYSHCDGVIRSRGQVAKCVVLKKFWAVMDDHGLRTIMWQEDGVELQSAIDLGGPRPPGRGEKKATTCCRFLTLRLCF